MRFIDLFCGLGGFHQALTQLGHRCVFASEIDPDLRYLYEQNYGVVPAGDIRDFYLQVPEHEVLCAGFPCQPFSKAGDQLGFDCPEWGDLFEYVIKIIQRRRPKFLIIENVPNIMKHNKGHTWARVQLRLQSAGFEVASKTLSPHQFGVPQLRDRVIIVGSRVGFANFSWPIGSFESSQLSISQVLDQHPHEAKLLSPNAVECLSTWQALIENLPSRERLPSFPIWAMEFGATYPYIDKTPASMRKDDLRKFRGVFGESLADEKDPLASGLLPSYAQTIEKSFPAWKVNFISQNRAFYMKNRDIIDEWMHSIRKFSASLQKLEWNWKEGPRDIWQTIVQFRASGIRAKKPTSAPSLVALTTSQVPVVTWQKRFMTLRECARLQSMSESLYLPERQSAGYKALGNAVNVKVISAVAKSLLAVPKEAVSRRKDYESRDFLELKRITNQAEGVPGES